MRSGIRGVLAGALALIALQVAVQPGASGRIAGLFGVPAAIASRFIDPTLPAIPDLRPAVASGVAVGNSAKPPGYPNPSTKPKIGGD